MEKRATKGGVQESKHRRFLVKQQKNDQEALDVLQSIIGEQKGILTDLFLQREIERLIRFLTTNIERRKLLIESSPSPEQIAAEKSLPDVWSDDSFLEIMMYLTEVSVSAQEEGEEESSAEEIDEDEAADGTNADEEGEDEEADELEARYGLLPKGWEGNSRSKKLYPKDYAKKAQDFFENGDIDQAAAMQERVFKFIVKVDVSSIVDQRCLFDFLSFYTIKGLTEFLRGKSAEALKSITSSIKISEQCWPVENEEESSSEYQNKLREHEDDVYAVISQCLEEESARDLALALTLLRKGRAIEEQSISMQLLKRRPRTKDKREELDGSMAEWHRLQTQLFQATFMRGSIGGTSKFRTKRLASLSEELQRVERDLSILASQERLDEPMPDEGAILGLKDIVTEVTKRLRERALIEFVHFEPRHLPPDPQRAKRDPARYLALVLLPDGKVVAANLGLAEKIENAVRGLPGASDISVSFSQAALSLTLDEDRTPRSTVAARAGERAMNSSLTRFQPTKPSVARKNDRGGDFRWRAIRKRLRCR